MKQRILFFLKITALVLFVCTFLGFLVQLSGSKTLFSRFDQRDAVYNNIEAFDPSLSRLNTLKKLEQYCDSLYANIVFAGGPVEFEKTYTDIASSVVRNRFYHGYSYYKFSDNYVAMAISKLTVSGLNALVMPDDILKHPYAACSQQSIVMMEVLKDKGFTTRKITFQGKLYGGHFAFEVFYDGTWHFHDPNLEPDKTVLNSYGRPGIDFLVHNPSILFKAYYRHSKAEIIDVFMNYRYGQANKFPAPKAIVFQKTTRFLSYTIWLFFLGAFLLARRALRLQRKASRRDNLVALPELNPDVTSMRYPDYKVQGA